MNEIIRAVRHHHDLVESKGYHVVMTSLVGSQNYGLDHEGSDIDTYSLILPSVDSLAQAEGPLAGIVFAPDGHCNFKDFREALNLLIKTSPNSIEYFASKYMVFNPEYEDILGEYLQSPKLYDMLHCNHKHMLYAIAGMAHQLEKRNMPAGKRFSHAMRLNDMVGNFLAEKEANVDILGMSHYARQAALEAKLDRDPTNDDFYNRQCAVIAKKMDDIRDKFELSMMQSAREYKGMKEIRDLQKVIFCRCYGVRNYEV